MKKIYCFDFDGTLTTRDTLLAFLRYGRGGLRFWCTMLWHAPRLVAMKLGLADNGRTKERVFRSFFAGMSERDFNALCSRFAVDHVHLLRRRGLDEMARANEAGVRVLVVTASIDRWVSAMLALFDVQAEVVGTQLEVQDGRLTGFFSTPNCYGPEKVRRIAPLIGDRSECEMTAFGDSRGDKELLEYADKRIYKPFR